MKRDTSQPRDALMFVVMVVIGIASIFIAQKFALTLFHFMHEIPNRDFVVKVSFAIVFLFGFWGVFLGFTRIFRIAVDLVKHNLSRQSTKDK